MDWARVPPKIYLYIHGAQSILSDSFELIILFANDMIAMYNILTVCIIIH